MSGEVIVRGSYGRAVIAERGPDLAVIRWPDGEVDAIASGWVTTPWSWASLPGLGTCDGEMYCWAWPGWRGRRRDGWLSSRRSPEQVPW